MAERRRSNTEALAVAIDRRARDHASRVRQVARGRVVRVRPLRVELEASAQPLDDDDFDLSSWAAWAYKELGIGVGDTALLLYEGGDYTIFDWVTGDTPDITGAKGLSRELKRLSRRLERLERKETA